jgi:hypothetical protein
MAVQFSTAVRNARLDAVETTLGTAAKLQIFTGTAPASCADASTGTQLVEITLPSDWMAAASGGSKAKSGTWSATAGATGTAGYFRVLLNDESVCHMQGTVTVTGGGGDMTIDNDAVVSGQTVTVSGFTLTDANA